MSGKSRFKSSKKEKSLLKKGFGLITKVIVLLVLHASIFALAKDEDPCVILMDPLTEPSLRMEVDVLGGREIVVIPKSSIVKNHNQSQINLPPRSQDMYSLLRVAIYQAFLDSFATAIPEFIELRHRAAILSERVSDREIVQKRENDLGRTVTEGEYYKFISEFRNQRRAEGKQFDREQRQIVKDLRAMKNSSRGDQILKAWYLNFTHHLDTQFEILRARVPENFSHMELKWVEAIDQIYISEPTFYQLSRPMLFGMIEALVDESYTLSRNVLYMTELDESTDLAVSVASVAGGLALGVGLFPDAGILTPVVAFGGLVVNPIVIKSLPAIARQSRRIFFEKPRQFLNRMRLKEGIRNAVDRPAEQIQSFLDQQRLAVKLQKRGLEKLSRLSNEVDEDFLGISKNISWEQIAEIYKNLGEKYRGLTDYVMGQILEPPHPFRGKVKVLRDQLANAIESNMMFDQLNHKDQEIIELERQRLQMRKENVDRILAQLLSLKQITKELRDRVIDLDIESISNRITAERANHQAHIRLSVLQTHLSLEQIIAIISNYKEMAESSDQQVYLLEKRVQSVKDFVSLAEQIELQANEVNQNIQQLLLEAGE